MKTVTVSAASYKIHQSAIVGLSDAQAAPRSHNLIATGVEGEYEVKNTIELKRGETFSIATESLPRADQEALGLVYEAPAPAAAGPAKPAPKPGKGKSGK